MTAITKRPLEDISTKELQMRWALFKSMEWGLADSFGAPAIRWTMRRKGSTGSLLQGVARFIMEQTAIKVFFGGPGEEKNLETARELLARGFGTIIDNAAPEVHSKDPNDAFNRAVVGYGKAIDICKKLMEEHAGEPEKQQRIAAAFKFSTIAGFDELKAISKALESPENKGKPLGERNLGDMENTFNEIYHRAKNFFTRAQELGIEPYVDAEETAVNPAIIELSARLMKEGLNPTVTIQAYLKDAEAQLDQLLAMDHPPNIKLVRGAYMGKARQEQAAIWGNKDETDACYNKLIEKIYMRNDVESLTAGTHNAESRKKAEFLVREAQAADRKAPRMIFATLLGMGGNLELTDPKLGIEERKYQPAIIDEETISILGSIEYFSRRANEFMSMPDPMKDDRTRARMEIEAINDELKHRGLGERTLAPARLFADTLKEAMRTLQKTPKAAAAV